MRCRRVTHGGHRGHVHPPKNFKVGPRNVHRSASFSSRVDLRGSPARARCCHGPRVLGVVHMVYVYKGACVTCVRRWPDSATSVSCARSKVHYVVGRGLDSERTWYRFHGFPNTSVPVLDLPYTQVLNSFPFDTPIHKALAS